MTTLRIATALVLLLSTPALAQGNAQAIPPLPNGNSFAIGVAAPPVLPAEATVLAMIAHPKVQNLWAARVGAGDFAGTLRDFALDGARASLPDRHDVVVALATPGPVLPIGSIPTHMVKPAPAAVGNPNPGA